LACWLAARETGEALLLSLCGEVGLFGAGPKRGYCHLHPNRSSRTLFYYYKSFKCPQASIMSKGRTCNSRTRFCYYKSFKCPQASIMSKGRVPELSNRPAVHGLGAEARPDRSIRSIEEKSPALRTRWYAIRMESAPILRPKANAEKSARSAPNITTPIHARQWNITRHKEA